MTTLNGRSPKDSYTELLKVNHLNSGFDSTLRTIEDGTGVASPLQLSTTGVALNGLKWPATTGTAGQLLRISNTSGLLEWGPTLGTAANQSSNNVTITGGTITGLSSPTNSSDAATKAYADANARSGGSFTAGTVLYSVPQPSGGWLQANGAVVTKATYPALANAIGTIPTSTTWTLSTSKTTAQAWGIDYCNGTYICSSTNTSGNPVISTSTDGINWTAQTVGSSLTTSYTACYGNNMYLSGGVNGYYATGTSPSSWTVRQYATSPSVVATYKYVFVNGTFYASCDNSVITTSTDGINWTAKIIYATPTALWGLAYGNNQFVTVGNQNSNSNAYIAYSPDGINWTSANVSSLPAAKGFRSVAYGNGKFVAVGMSGLVVTSPDGVTWTQQTTAFGTNNIYTITFNGVFVAAGNNNVIAYSSDGITWTTMTSAFTSGSSILSSCNYGGKFLAGTSGGVIAYSNMFSYDASTSFKLPSLSSYLPAVPYIKT